ncbi:MAG: family N-acetyltransferase [Paenibacillaceae bacterium]|nr:family N-acetyltransferase [Paenibacillaceae bacterium]
MGEFLGLSPIGPELADLELGILNSDIYFNKVCKGKELLTVKDVEEDRRESDGLGTERFFLRDGGKVVGILDYLLHNPGDGYPWLGLLLIAKEMQGHGYGLKALATFEQILRNNRLNKYRIGVVAGNKPAERFWHKRGFVKVKSVQQETRVVDVYEKQIG